MKTDNSNNTFRVIKGEDKQELEFISRKHIEMPSLWMENYKFSEQEITDNIKEMETAFCQDRIYCIVAEQKNTIISFLWAEIDAKKNDRMDIISLWTNSDFRRLGIATKLKEKMEIFAINHKVKKIYTTVSANNRKIVELNEKLGYKINYHTMSKELSE